MARKPASPKPAAPLVQRPKRVIPQKKDAEASSSPAKPVKRSAVKKSSPKKSTTSHRKSKKNDSKPTYERMIYKALKDLGGRTVHSSVAIAKWIEANYPVPEESFKRSVRVALKRGVEDGLFIQNKASFKLSAKGIEKNGGKRSTSHSGNKRKRAVTAKEGQPRKRTTRNSKKAGTAEEPKTSSSRSKKVVENAAPVAVAKAPKASRAASKVAPKKAAPKAKPIAASKKRSSKKTDKSEASSESSNSNAVKKPQGIVGDHMWQYEDNGWKNYEVNASNTVEEVYQAYLANRGDTDVRAVKSGQWEYMVDFMAMKQTNIQHDNHTIRNIRRISVSE